jgi:hypothetical protein
VLSNFLKGQIMKLSAESVSEPKKNVIMTTQRELLLQNMPKK